MVPYGGFMTVDGVDQRVYADYSSVIRNQHRFQPSPAAQHDHSPAPLRTRAGERGRASAGDRTTPGGASPAPTDKALPEDVALKTHLMLEEQLAYWHGPLSRLATIHTHRLPCF